MDMKTAMQQVKPVIGLPKKPAPQPAAPQPAAPAAPQPAPKQKMIEPLGPAELLFHESLRDGCLITFYFLGGSSMIAKPVALGKYSFRIQTEDGGDAAIFKSALRLMSKVNPHG
jgi:hypothetical protein